MPGPGKKKTKSKPKPRDAVIDWPMAPDSLNWNIRADFICDMLGVPSTWSSGRSQLVLTLFADMKSRASLKLVHKDIDSVQRKLDKMYDEYDDDHVRGTIACIWGKLCCDMLLRDQLLKKGAIEWPVALSIHTRSSRYSGQNGAAASERHMSVRRPPRARCHEPQRRQRGSYSDR